jgi:hypothetical protein
MVLENPRTLGPEVEALVMALDDEDAARLTTVR